MVKRPRIQKLIQGWFNPKRSDDSAIVDAADKYLANGYSQKQLIAEGVRALVEKNGGDIPMPQYGGITLEDIGRAVAKEMGAQKAALDDILRMISSGALIAASSEAQEQIDASLTDLEESLGHEYRSMQDDEDE